MDGDIDLYGFSSRVLVNRYGRWGSTKVVITRGLVVPAVRSAPKQSHNPGNRAQPLMCPPESPILLKRGEIPAALSCVIAVRS